ncbi:MAG: ribonuclease III [Rhodothermales bacterium]
MAFRLPNAFRTTLNAALGRPHTPEGLAEDENALVPRRVIEGLVGARVGDMRLYEQALCHRSMLRGQPGAYLASNERLEFLGDAVLGFVVAEHLYLHFPGENEGFLTRLRAKVVSGAALARCARRLQLGAHILMSENAVQAEGRRNASILADTLEALIGALYLDSGLDAARVFITAHLREPVNLPELARQRRNYKSLLLEYAQARGWAQPRYHVTTLEGPSHDRTFTVEVLLNDEAYGEGTAQSKKKAEQQAAGQALERVRAEEAAAKQTP